MGLQINQYPNTTVSLDPLAVFDVDNWTGAAFQSEQVPMSVMEAAFSKNIINTDLTQTANRVQDFAGFQQYWKNNNQLVIESASTPVSGANIEVIGFGTTSSDEMFEVNNNLGNRCMTVYGDQSINLVGQTKIDGNTAIGASSVNSGVKLLVQGTSNATGVYLSGTPTTQGMLVGVSSNYGIYASNSKAGGIIVKTIDVSTTGTNIGNQSEMRGVGTGTNICFQADARNGATNYALDILNGDIRVPSGGIGFSGTGAYTNFTIEKGIIISAS